MANPLQTVLELFYGRWRSQTLHAGVKLGIFEAIGPAPADAGDVARELGLDAALAYRLLRALASLDLLREHDARAFSLTDAGAILRADHPQSMRDALLLREGGPSTPASGNTCPTSFATGARTASFASTETDAFDHASRDPAYGRAFDAGMSSQSNLQTGWTLDALRECDLSTIARLCDVGGGQGHLLAHFLVRYPHLRGIVFDWPSVIDAKQAPWAEKLAVGDRCSAVAGDMFVAVPAADAYLLKMILHDWNDAECVRILGNLRRRATGAGRLFVVEHVIRAPGGADYAALFDMHMMCWGSGRERTAPEFQALLEAAGWRFVATWFAPSGAIAVVEGALPDNS